MTGRAAGLVPAVLNPRWGQAPPLAAVHFPRDLAPRLPVNPMVSNDNRTHSPGPGPSPPGRRNPSEAAMYRTILVPLDGSALAEQALPLALSVAHRARADLRLVRVHSPAPAGYADHVGA